MQKFLNSEHEKAYNLMLEKDYQQALKIFDNLIYLFPNEANLFSDRGVIFIHQNKKEEALKDFDQAVFLEDWLRLAGMDLNSIIISAGWCVWHRAPPPGRWAAAQHQTARRSVGRATSRCCSQSRLWAGLDRGGMPPAQTSRWM